VPELGKRRETPKELEKKRLSTALMKVAERSLAVTRRDVDAYVPREVDLRIAEAMLSGHITFKAIADSMEVSSQYISQHMRDPLVCAWISSQIHQHVNHRLGLIDAAMLNRALAGDVNAAKLCYQRFGQMVNRSQHVHVTGSMDFSKMSDDDLTALVRDAQKQKIIDVEPGTPDSDSDGDGGAEAPEA
jgi:hypothetical protein